MLVSLVLYGSRARGDHRQKSDVDLLGVVEEGLIRSEFSAGGTSLYRYPSKLLVENAKRGDLFVLHLVTEGIVLHDSFGVFRGVKDSFRFKEDYSGEIASGYMVAKFFETRPHLLRDRAARKRLVWAIRTMLIASCAEKKQACFSSDSLARVSGISGLKGVIDDRNRAEFDGLVAVARRVADRFGADRFEGDWPQSAAAQIEAMEKAGGLPASTLRLLKPLRRLRFKRPPLPEPVQSMSDYF